MQEEIAERKTSVVEALNCLKADLRYVRNAYLKNNYDLNNCSVLN